MAPKTHFTIPLGNTVDVVTRSRRSTQDVQTTERVVPQLSKKKTCTKASAQQHDNGDIPQTLDDTEERYPLHVHEDQDDLNDTPMEQWLDHRDRYLHLLLEMEGVTQAPKCSVCSKAMEVKCSDCIGGIYFCKACCIQSHRSSPFHWMSQWTGSHFMPVSLYSLGFVLGLGHQGHPCPMTLEGIQAAEKAQCSKKKSMQTKSASLKAINEETSPSPELPDISDAYLPAESLHYLSDPLFGCADPLIDTSPGNAKRLRIAASGNPLLTVVHQSGVFNMEVLYCICPNAGEKDEQLFKQIETAFTFSALEEFLTDNLECKTTAQQYFSKLQGITNQMFPQTVPNLYRQLLRASHQWRDLRNRMQSGLGHQDDDGIDGSMAIFCPAYPQSGINLPDDWKIRYNENQLIRTFIMDGNFAAEHIRSRSGDKDVPLSLRMAFMANPEAYKTHLKSGQESIQPSTCNTYKAIEQANSSRPHLDVTGIGATACCHGFFVPTSVVDFQKGERQVNMDYSLCKALSYNMEDIPVALVIYITGAKQVDGEIIETFSIHLEEVEENGSGHGLNKGYETQRLLIKVMLMHKVAPSLAEIQQKLISEESRDPTTRGQTSWIASGIRIQELQLAIKYQLRTSGTNMTTDATIHSSLHIAMLEIPPSPIWAYMMYPEHSSHSLDQPLSLASDGSGMDSPNPEDLPILLPSSLGWHWICLALGFKSALFRTQVRSANTQQTKTCAWSTISSVDTTVHEHARIYSMARDAFWNIQQAHPDALELLTLTPQDLHVATLVLGSDKPGQRNTQQSWIWSFGQTSEDEGTWMDDSQFERWLEEQQSIHDEAQWVPAYFHAKAEAWKKLMVFTVKGICIISDAHVGAAGSKISKGTFSDYP
ncbi:hypothetical protein EI94DRAFT_1707799 [Lactarius quietus]|nr:hypothetical protein EI94DRAFT_1707799 [Lactarius quietus]